MYEEVLKLICEHKIYTEIKGMTSPGTEKILEWDNDTEVYHQKNCVFTSEMVSTILFHKFGCTITLKH